MIGLGVIIAVRINRYLKLLGTLFTMLRADAKSFKGVDFVSEKLDQLGKVNRVIRPEI